MKNSIILFLLLVPAFLFAQYPTGTNKSRLGYQTTGDGLIWRGVAADTAIKPRTTANAYFQLDTVNRILRRYIATQGSWQTVGGGGTSVDSLIYATRYWVGTNFFPLEGGTLTGTGGAGFIGFPSQVSAPGTPASGLNVYAQGSSFNWKGTDGYERQFASTLTGGRTYTLPDVSGTFALGTGTADRLSRWTGTNTLSPGNLSDNGTKLQALLPWQFQTYTTAGLPTGVTGYTVYNTTLNGIGWYDGTRWNYVPKSDRSAFTATYIPYINSSGQLTENSNIRFESDYRLILNHTNYNNIIGRDAGKTTATGTYNNVIGGLAGFSLTSGQRNNFFGAASGYSVTSGSYNVFIGNSNGNSSTTASYNVFIGDLAGFTNTTGGSNVFIGRQAGNGNTTGNQNIAIGYDAGRNNQTGLNNISIGYRAGRANTVDGNIFIGEDAGLNNTTGSPNFFMGYRAGVVNTTGNFNFIAGSQSGVSNTTGSYNLFLGANVGFANTIGNNNIFIGRDAGNASTIASDNTYIGSGAGFSAVSGGGNTLIGRQAGYYIKNGQYNTVVGFDAGNTGIAADTLGGDRNILIGYQAGKNIKSDADRNIAIGNVDLPSATSDNQLTIGNLIFGTGLTGTGTTIAGNAGIKIATPTEDFDVNGDAYIRDSTRLTTTPAHSAITGLLTRNTDGWVGLASLAGGLSYSGGVLTGANIYTADGTQTGNRILTGSNYTLDFDGLKKISAYNFNYGSAYYRMQLDTNEFRIETYKTNGVGMDFGKGVNYSYWTTDTTSSVNSQLRLYAGAKGLVFVPSVGGAGYSAFPNSNPGTGSNINVWDNGTPSFKEIKRDTTIFVTADTDYDFSAAVTTAQIASRYNRIIIHMTLTSGVGADKTTTLHTPDANLMQCEILIRGTDNTGTYDNEIAFGTNNAISSDGTNTSGYTLAQGQGLHVRVVYNGSAYKYIYY